jgi:hypothetical protein
MVEVAGGLSVARGKMMDVSKDPNFAGLTATLVTVDLDQVMPDEVLGEFNKILGIPAPPGRRGPAGFLGPRVAMSMHAQQVPLLDALLRFSAQVKSRVRTLTPQMVELSPPPPTNLNVRAESGLGVWCLAGPFAVSLDRVDLSASYEATDTVRREATLAMTLYAEPKVKVAQFPQKLKVQSFVDEKDQEIALDAPTGGIANRTPAMVRMKVQLPEQHGHKLAMLRGSAPFQVVTESEDVETGVPVTSAVTKAVGGMTVEFLPSGAGIPAMTLRFSRGAMPAEKWAVISPLLTSVAIDAFGGNAGAQPPNVRLENGGRGGAGPAQGPLPETVSVTATFGRSNTAFPAADRAVVRIPLGVRVVDVPFEFKDLVLP